jgi:uncharacterized protein (DUF362 family)
MDLDKVDFAYNIDALSEYPEAPFLPDRDYPEFSGVFKQFDPTNRIYKSIRDLFINSGYDKENIGTSKWNPFRGYINEGQVALIKPNLVYEETKDFIGTNCLLTHASIIRPVIDYLNLLQVKEKIKFRIIVADIPIQGADFDKIVEQTGLRSLHEFYSNEHMPGFEIYDLRHKIAVFKGNGFFTTIDNAGDPSGYSKIHLEKSFLQSIAKDFRKFGAPGYGHGETFSQIEQTGKHFYHIPNTVLDADLFINMPKVKTHKKAGVTLAMKNLIGINGEKAWVPHYRRGSIKHGGDEFDDKQILLKAISSKANLALQGKSRLLWGIAKKINQLIIKRFFRKDFKIISGQTELERKALFLLGGDWYGNDTLWRSILDLNYLLLFADKEGKEAKNPVRNYICLCDGIISGEGDGPLSPYPKKTGLLTLSRNPVLNDVCLSRIMGFDWRKIPKLKNSIGLKEYFGFDGDVEKIHIINSLDTNIHETMKFDILPNLKFLPTPGWLHYIEIKA